MNPAELFRQESNTVQLAPGEFLYREGDRADKMYVLLEGEVDIRVGDYVKTLREGALIGEVALVDDSPRAANAVANSACRLAQIDRQRFDFLVQEHPYFARHVMKSLVDHLRYVIFRSHQTPRSLQNPAPDDLYSTRLRNSTAQR